MISNTFAVDSCRVWDVKTSPDRKHIIGSHYAPTLGIRKRRRRISIEVRRPARSKSTSITSSDNCSDDSDGEGEQFDTNSLMLGLLCGEQSARAVDGAIDLSSDDKVVLSFLKPVSKGRLTKRGHLKIRRSRSTPNFSEYLDTSDDSCSVSSLGFLGPSDEPDNDVWVEHDSYDVNSVRIVSRIKNTMEIIVGEDSKTVQRKIYFSDSKDSRRFFHLFMNVESSLKERESKLNTFPILEEMVTVEEGSEDGCDSFQVNEFSKFSCIAPFARLP